MKPFFFGKRNLLLDILPHKSKGVHEGETRDIIGNVEKIILFLDNKTQTWRILLKMTMVEMFFVYIIFRILTFSFDNTANTPFFLIFYKYCDDITKLNLC